MNLIKDLLQKYTNFGTKEKLLKEKIIKILEEKYGILLGVKDLEIKNKKIFLKVCGPSKTEIILNKNKIINDIDEKIIDIN